MIYTLTAYFVFCALATVAILCACVVAGRASRHTSQRTDRPVLPPFPGPRKKPAIYR